MGYVLFKLSRMKLPLELSKFSYHLAILLFISCIILSCERDKPDEEIYLLEDHGFLQIPGVGWQTFGRTADEDVTLKYYKFKSGTAYTRWYWSKLEPVEGQIAFGMIDTFIERCRSNNQALAFRVMCEDPTEKEGIPKWLIDKRIKMNYTICPQQGDHYVPDMADPVFVYYHERLIRALGEHYDDHPDIALVDIGSVGMWGEWHIYCDPTLMPDRAIRNAVTDLYFEAFPNTPLTAQVDDSINIDYALTKGPCGWRGDSWGNADISMGWTHHQGLYWPIHNRIPNAWETGTIAMEPGMPTGAMDGWTAPITKIVDDAIAWHTTFAHNKSEVVPSEFISEIERLVMKMGFRLVLRRLDYNKTAQPGSKLIWSMEWENLGIASPYRDYRIALRLRDINDKIKAVEITDLSIKGWLPGKIINSLEYNIPADLPAGDYGIELGVVFHSSLEHNIPIANKGKTEDGWYKVGKLTINN
jgi:hypothetical protein